MIKTRSNFHISRNLIWRSLQTLLLVAAITSTPAMGAKLVPLQLIQLFSDPEQKVPLQGEPYRIFIDGKLSDSGVTDEEGVVITHRRHPGVRQEFVAQIFSFGTYSFVAGKNDRVVVEKIANWNLQKWADSCDRRVDDCKGKGFYWIQLLGRELSFEGEPYSLKIADEIFTGTVSSDGYIFAPKNYPVPTSVEMSLRLCSGPAIKVVAGVSYSDSSATLSKVANVPAPSAESCRASIVARYIKDNPSLNRGMPYVLSEWSKGLRPIEIAQEENLKQQAELDEYRLLAASNSDSLAWLGALPSEWSDDEYQSRLQLVFERIKDDLSTMNEKQFRQFQCSPPGKIGPVPDMDAVEKYLNAFPESMYDHHLLVGLNEAAAKGNWLAVAQVYVRQSQIGGSYLERYRLVQLMEWLQARKIGVLYREFGAALDATGISNGLQGNGVTSIDIYAALHSSYPAQYEVGRQMSNSDDTELRLIGKNMMDCAVNSVPGYKRLLESN